MASSSFISYQPRTRRPGQLTVFPDGHSVYESIMHGITTQLTRDSIALLAWDVAANTLPKLLGEAREPTKESARAASDSGAPDQAFTERECSIEEVQLAHESRVIRKLVLHQRTGNKAIPWSDAIAKAKTDIIELCFNWAEYHALVFRYDDSESNLLPETFQWHQLAPILGPLHDLLISLHAEDRQRHDPTKIGKNLTKGLQAVCKAAIDEERARRQVTAEFADLSVVG